MPLVLGGGIVRDAIMGGQPNDIDVWLPSECHIRNAQEAQAWVTAIFGVSCDIIFSGPENVEEAGEGYRDMSNHWVLEFSLHGFKVNLMRTMTPWVEGDPAAFFRGVMRNFDIDLCMFFLALEREGIHTPYVIMPRHLQRQLEGVNGVTPQIRQFCWNGHRLDTMSDARRTMRSDKMHQKFPGLGPEGTIEVDEIEPQVVTIAWLMTKMEYFPFPPAPPRDTMTAYGSSRDGLHPTTEAMRAELRAALSGVRADLMWIDEAAPIAPQEEDPNAAPLPPPPQMTNLGVGGWLTITPEMLAEANARITRTPDGHIEW